MTFIGCVTQAFDDAVVSLKKQEKEQELRVV